MKAKFASRRHPMHVDYGIQFVTNVSGEYYRARAPVGMTKDGTIRYINKDVPIRRHGKRKAKQLARIYRDLFELSDPRVRAYYQKHYANPNKHTRARTKTATSDKREYSCPDLVGVFGIVMNTRGGARAVIAASAPVWDEPGRCRQRTFSVSYYGLSEALERAVRWRVEQTYSQYPSKAKLRKAARHVREYFERRDMEVS